MFKVIGKTEVEKLNNQALEQHATNFFTKTLAQNYSKYYKRTKISAQIIIFYSCSSNPNNPVNPNSKSYFWTKFEQKYRSPKSIPQISNSFL